MIPFDLPLAKGVVIHGAKRPLLGRKLRRKSQQELRDLGLLVETPGEQHG